MVLLDLSIEFIDRLISTFEMEMEHVQQGPTNGMKNLGRWRKSNCEFFHRSTAKICRDTVRCLLLEQLNFPFVFLDIFA